MDYSKFDVADLIRKVKEQEKLSREESIAYNVLVVKFSEEQAICIEDKSYIDVKPFNVKKTSKQKPSGSK